MPGLAPARVVGFALRCYPRRWRRRHGAEAAELAALLIADGVPARSVACSYLCAAARERLTPQPGHRLAAAVAALLIAAGSLGVPLGLLSASAPASAASATRAHSASPARAHSASPARAHSASPAAQPRCAGHPAHPYPAPHSHRDSHPHPHPRLAPHPHPHPHPHPMDGHGEHC